MAEAPGNEVSSPVDRAAYWQAMLEEWAGSGLTQQAFCAGRGINPHTFSWWKHRLRPPVDGERPARRPARRATPAFVELAGPVRPTGWAYEVQLPNGRILRLGQAVEPAELAALLAVLERPC